MDTELFDTFKILFESEATPENIYQELTTKTPDPSERLSLFNEIRTYFEAFKPIETLSLNDPPIYVADVMTYLSKLITLEGYHLPDDIKHGEYLWYNDSDVFKYKRIKELKKLIQLIDATTFEPNKVPIEKSIEIQHAIIETLIGKQHKHDCKLVLTEYVKKKFLDNSITKSDVYDKIRIASERNIASGWMKQLDDNFSKLNNITLIEFLRDY